MTFAELLDWLESAKRIADQDISNYEVRVEGYISIDLEVDHVINTLEIGLYT